jgi:hypothetical protein
MKIAPPLKLCSELDLDLFCVEGVMEEEDDKYKLPEGPIILGLEELIQITAEKKRSPMLSERKIRVMGRRMERFIPPRWKPKGMNKLISGLEESRLQEKGLERGGKRRVSEVRLKRDKRCKSMVPAQDGRGVPSSEEEGADVGFLSICATTRRR